MDDETKIYGLTQKQWEAAFRPGMHEFAATSFIFTREGPNLVRIAFGNSGPHMSETIRQAVFTHAVTLPPEVAVELAGMLLKAYAEPEAQRSSTSGQL